MDLIVNPQARRLAETRSAVVQSVRSTLISRGFLEVETPVLTGLHGGANARPFITHGNAYDSRLYLRIALELYLKRLVVGGIESVFEIGRIFRNEGVDTTHNPEFTMLEAYQTYSDYNGIGELTQTLVQNAAVAAFGSTVIRRADGTEWDIGGEWRSLGVHEAISLAARRGGHADTRAAGAAGAVRAGGRAAAAVVEPRPGDPGDVRAAGGEADRGADVLPRLPRRGVAADPAAPRPTRGSRSGGTS